jgi:hypothetical protein
VSVVKGVGSFAFGAGAGWIAGYLLIGVSTGGIGLIVIGVAAAGAGYVAGKAGEKLGEMGADKINDMVFEK